MDKADKYKDKILYGDALETLKTIPDQTAQMCVTSPPYWGLRDYGVEGQLGLEQTPEEYIEKLTNVFREVRRALKDDGTLWLNLGDSYCGSNSGGIEDNKAAQSGSGKTSLRKHRPNKEIEDLKPKDLCMIPARVAMSLQADGWYLRSDIIWHKPNPMPESVKDRPTKAHEYLFLLSKSKQYYYDWEAIAEDVAESTKERVKYPRFGNGNKGTGGEYAVTSIDYSDREKECDKRNRRSVWAVSTKSYPEAHFAVYPPELIAPCIKAGSKPYDIVLDPFFGSGTTGEVCQRLNRHYLGIELNEDYEGLQNKRLSQRPLKFKYKPVT